MKKTLAHYFFTFFVASVFIFDANATLVSITDLTGANAGTITNSPPNPIAPNPNDGVLLAWDEVQNLKLLFDLPVDRVFDDTDTTIVRKDPGGELFLKAGTIVSSHYLQWDPGDGSSSSVTAQINLDSQVFAFITADAKLFASDAVLGLPGLDYADFTLRGLESGDTTVFDGPNVDIDWTASTPGDWTRLITAYSPIAAQSVPEPSTYGVWAAVLIGALIVRRRITSKMNK